MAAAGDDKLPESIVIKLFDQMKDANSQNTEAVKDLTRVVGDLTKCIERQPDLNDMAKMCINRGYECNSIKDLATKSHNNTKKILNRISVMILVVLVTFTLMTTSYFFVRNSVENMIDRRVDEIHKVMDIKTGEGD